MDKKQLFQNFQDNWGRFITPFEIESINQWIDEDGMPIEVVNEALRETVNYNVKTMHYLNRILSKWQQNNVTTFEAVELTRRQWHEQRKPKSNSYSYQSPYGQQLNQERVSNVPEWASEPYRTVPTAEEQKELDELKRQMLGL